jgi:hypothetical protein
MRSRCMRVVPLALAAAVIGPVVALGTPGTSGAAPSPTCPSVGSGQGCAYVITVNSDGTASVAPGTNPQSYDNSEDVMVGVLNNTSGVVPSVYVSGPSSFAFDTDGLCNVSGAPTGCPFVPPGGFTSTGYEGPGTAFSVASPSDGTVVFTTPLAPGATAYFSLEARPTSASGIVVDKATIADQTTGKSFTTDVATIADGNVSDTASNFSATVNWGDGSAPDTVTPSPVTGGFIVSGTHAYATHGTFAPVVTVSTAQGASASVTDSVTVSDLVVTCPGGTSTCTGSVTTNNLSLTAQTTQTSAGDLLFSTDPNSGATGLSCGDSFRHAPRVITETDSFSTGSSSITSTETFAAKDGTAGKGLAGLFFWVCFQSSPGHPFVDATGHSTTLGLLPLCNPFKPGAGPCVNFILPAPGGKVVERVTYPVGDPRMG